MNLIERALLEVAPGWSLRRYRARVSALALARHYEAAQIGRRTSGWARSSADANAANGPALSILRAHARELVRNNAWARRGLSTIGNNAVGWGIVPKAVMTRTRAEQRAAAAWRAWGESLQCDHDGRHNFYGLQRLAIQTIAQSGEVLVRRYWRAGSAGLALPMQIQVLEGDVIDTSIDGRTGEAGGPIVQGVEFDARGRRVAYWLFDQHPGADPISTRSAYRSSRVPAEDVLHVYRVDRPGQVRGVSWFAPVIVTLKDFDEFEDATLVRQKIAACFAAFVTDATGTALPVGKSSATDATFDGLEPGMIKALGPGQDVRFADPPTVSEHEGYSVTNLRRAAAGLGVTYEDLTGDYSRVNFSSARMARIAHWNDVHDWRWNMLIPQLCDGVWSWAMEAALVAGIIGETPPAKWTPPPMPMLEPDKEGLAFTRMIRSGVKTLSEVIREQGGDPDEHLAEYAADLAKLDELGIWLDSDVRRVTQSGLSQAKGAGSEPGDAESEETEDERALVRHVLEELRGGTP